MQTETTSNAGYTMAFIGSTAAITMQDILQILGVVGVFVGIGVTVWGRLIERKRVAEMSRASDLKERELDLKERELNDAKK